MTSKLLLVHGKYFNDLACTVDSCREMGKKGKWISAVNSAFRSPTKEKEYEIFAPVDLDLLGDLPPLIVVIVLHIFLEPVFLVTNNVMASSPVVIGTCQKFDGRAVSVTPSCGCNLLLPFFLLGTCPSHFRSLPNALQATRMK